MTTDETIIFNLEQKIIEALEEICEEADVSIGHVKKIGGEVFMQISLSTKI